MFFKRLISGAVMLALTFVFIYFGGYALAAMLLFLSEVAFFELGRALKIFEGRQNALMIYGYIAVAAYYFVLSLIPGHQSAVLCAVLVIIGFLAIYVFSFPKYDSKNITSAVFSFLYAPVMPSFMLLTRQFEEGLFIVWMVYICSWGADTLAYFVGMLTGKTIGNHKMTPKLSPKKSIEGAVGGILGAALIAWLYAKFVLNNFAPGLAGKELEFAIIGGVGGAISMIGDLAASAIKRNEDIKDYGHLIPGHGGVMDRFDSVIITAPLIYILATLLLG